MDSDVLVETIVRRVLTQLRQECLAKNAFKIMVFDSHSEALQERIAQCVANKDVSMEFWSSGQSCQDADRYIIPRLSCIDMADLAQGQAKSPLSEVVLQLLLTGVKVEVLDYDYKAYEKKASSELYKVYLHYEQVLTSFGLVPFKPDPEPVARYWQQLISENEVADAINSGAKEMHLTKNSIVTPLAMDHARLNNIEMHKKL
ncbi:MAG: hypothetical protein ACK5MF_13655 [Vibrio sp.]|uniref:hypothetical protein n=1 Tax=Vibrio sp. TaxID=678 RepID=UPI003A8C21EF